ncbi:ATP-binding protein [Acetobacteraceae bacterium KSS8]|uniref:histidine kinase n=1 Tax=Endosaccharibacter trunci TaxID=2812733 RepID=A0ABT1W6S0_9PROT|nr:ATP-binding protein [Acetobacteraceae bacterium KSS8]
MRIASAPIRPVLLLLAALVCAGLASLAAGALVERAAIRGLLGQARSDAELRAALLNSEIARFRLLPLALADDRDILAGLSGDAADRAALNRKLAGLAVTTGAAVIYVVGRDGIAVAASNWAQPDSFVGRDYRFRRYFRRAISQGEDDQFARGTVSRNPGLYLARRNEAGGVTVVKVEFYRLEAEWARAGGITFVENPDGVVLVSSRADWRFGLSRPLSRARADAFSEEASIAPTLLKALPVRAGRQDGRVSVDGRAFVSASVSTGEPGWRLSLLLPVGAGPKDAARGAMAVTALAVLLAASLLWAMGARRRRVRRQTAELERAVASRTAELTREMEERREIEARAADLRERLRQANRLASLGQVTASVAHETAQPVAAIRTYSETSEMLLDRGDLDTVRGNLQAIRRLADRVGAVTTELRGFARRATGQLRPVALSEVIDGALLILREQLNAIRLERPVVDPALRVIGGRVRLEQVLVNLLQNAIEALAGRPDARVDLVVAAEGETVRLMVSDNGPGIPPAVADRLFTPFMTTRDNGLGLGLVIAQDIMSDLGGSLRLLERTEGAAFEITMRAAS